MVKSIFEIERRVDLEKDYQRVLNTLKSTTIYGNYFWDYINSVFSNWCFRDTAVTWQQYLEDIGIYNIYNCSEEEKFFVFQFIVNIISFIFDNYITQERIKNGLFNIITTISRILERLNYKLDNVTDKYIIVKRDSDVDSIIINNKDINIFLLGYNDFSIENNLTEKKQLLKHIYDYIESKTSEYKETNNTLFKNISYIVNNFHIRHENSKQIQISSNDLIVVYDTCFKMMIHLIREHDIKNAYSTIENTYKIE